MTAATLFWWAMSVKAKYVLQDYSWSVYCVTHKASGHEYFGQTNQTLNLRWRDHVLGALRDPKTRFLKAIAEYGPDAFEGKVLLEGLTQEEASGYESMLIQSKDPRRVFNEYVGGGALVREEDRVLRGKAISESPAYRAHRERLKAKWADPEQRAIWLAARDTMKSSAAHKANWQNKTDAEKAAQLDRMRAARVAKGQIQGDVS